jgi:hypothetical protein
LNVAAAAVDARQVQRSAAQEGDCFSLALAETARRDLAVSLFAFSGVAEQDVCEFVKRVCAGESLHIAGDPPRGAWIKRFIFLIVGDAESLQRLAAGAMVRYLCL